MHLRLSLAPTSAETEDAAEPAEAPAPRLMTASEVGDLLRMPRSTVYELARTQRIPYLKVGRRTLFDPVTLMAWIADRVIPPRP